MPWSKLVIPIILACLIFTVMILAMAQDSGEKTRSGQNIYHTQEARDAVQDEKIKSLEASRIYMTSIIEDIRDKQNVQIGGVAAFGLLLTALQVVQLRRQK